MGRVRRLTIVSRDPDLVQRGILPWRRADITLNWLATSAWTLTLPATPAVRERVQPGWGIIAYLDGEQILSGSVEDPERTRSATNTDASGVGLVTVTGSDDLAIVASELAWPSPTLAVTGQIAAHDAEGGAAESVIKHFVSANVGSTRHANRRDAAAPNVREVVVAADSARGAVVSYQARFDNLMDIIRECHGGLGVQVTQTGSDLVFDVVVPTDRSTSATFSFESRNLSACEWSIGLPEATHVVVAGQGEGEERLFRLRKNSSAANLWRMTVAQFVDQRHTSEVDELDQAGDEELERGRRAGVISATLVDTARLAYGTHYQLGDTVTIAPEPGTSFTDKITTLRIVADADTGRLSITPAVGWGDDPWETPQERIVRDQDRRVSRLERSV